MPTVWTEVKVDVDLGKFSTDDLLEELGRRGKLPPDISTELISTVYHKRRNGQSIDQELDRLIYQCIGRV